MLEEDPRQRNRLILEVQMGGREGGRGDESDPAWMHTSGGSVSSCSRSEQNGGGRQRLRTGQPRRILEPEHDRKERKVVHKRQTRLEPGVAKDDQKPRLERMAASRSA